MAQQWGYQGSPQGQDFQNYYPDPQYQQPPQFSDPQQQPHSQVYPQEQNGGPQQGPQYDPYQQQYPQQQMFHQHAPQFNHQQPAPQYTQQPDPHYNQHPPGPQFNQMPGSTFDQQSRPQFVPPPDYQQNQHYGQSSGYSDSSAHQQSHYASQQAPQHGFDRPQKPPMRLAKPSPTTCFNCGSPDHWAMYCQEPRRAVPAGKLEHSQSQACGLPQNGFNPPAVTNQYPPQPSPSIGQMGNGYSYGNPQYSPPTNHQAAIQYSQGIHGSPQTPISASSASQFPGPFQQPQPPQRPQRSSLSAPMRSIPPSPVTSTSHQNVFSRPPVPHEHTLERIQNSSWATVPSPAERRPTQNVGLSEVKKARAATVEPSEEGEVSRGASVQSSRRSSIDQSVCMESEAEQDATSEAATPDYEPADAETQEEVEDDDLEQLDIPDAPKYPGPFDAIGPQPVRFPLPAEYELYGGLLEVLQRPSPGSNGFVQSGYITKKSILEMDHKFIDLPQYQRDTIDPICLILHGDLKDALALEEPEPEEEMVEGMGDEGTDRSMSCDEDEENDEEDFLRKENSSSPKSTEGTPQRLPQQYPQQHRPSQRHYRDAPSLNSMPYRKSGAAANQTDWETEQKLAALGVTGAPKPNRMPARSWQPAEAFRQPRHPPVPPPPEPLPIREEPHHLSPVWHQGTSARHESTPGLDHIWDAPSPPRGTGTPPYVPDVHEDPAEDNPWVPPGGHEVQIIGKEGSGTGHASHEGSKNGYAENGHSSNDARNQASSYSTSVRRPSDSNGTFPNPTSPTSSRLPMQNSSAARSPEESRPVWKSNATIRTSFKDRFARINRKREFEAEEPSDEERGKERKRQEDDVTPRNKRRQPQVADAYSRRW